MDNALLVRGVERVGDLDGQLQKGIIIQGLARDALLERLAFEQFHDDEGLRIVLVNLVNGADVRVVQGGGGASFPLKPLHGLVITRHLIGQELDGHVPAQACVFSFINDTHPTAAEFFKNPVMRNNFVSRNLLVSLCCA